MIPRSTPTRRTLIFTLTFIVVAVAVVAASGGDDFGFNVNDNEPVLQRSGSNWSLFGGNNSGETLRIFKDSSPDTNPLTVILGDNDQGLRLGGNGSRWQVTGDYVGYSDIQTTTLAKLLLKSECIRNLGTLVNRTQTYRKDQP